MGARRVQAAALFGGAALLLLLLGLPPSPAPPRPHTASPPRTPPPLNTTTAPLVSSRLVDSSSKSSLNFSRVSISNQTVSQQERSEKPKKEVKTDPPKKSNLVYTKDVYVAGHETPHPELCPALGADVMLLIMISSAPSHSQARQAVRMTWGHYATRKDIALAFFLGVPPQSMRPAIEKEDALYGDVVIGNSIDSYSNLTLKTLSMLEWADTYCPRTPRILKTDDDMFINVPKLLKFMQSNGRPNATKTIWGKVLKKSLPKRSPSSKYYLSWEQFPPKVLPDFATGPAYLMTRDIVTDLFEHALKEPYLRLEDVFITGVVAGKLGVKRQHASEFYNKRVALHPCAVQRGIAIHMIRYHEQFDLWRKLLDGKTKCAT